MKNSYFVKTGHQSLSVNQVLYIFWVEPSGNAFTSLIYRMLPNHMSTTHISCSSYSSSETFIGSSFFWLKTFSNWLQYSLSVELRPMSCFSHVSVYQAQIRWVYFRVGLSSSWPFTIFWADVSKGKYFFAPIPLRLLKSLQYRCYVWISPHFSKNATAL